VKGCRGIARDLAALEPLGLAHDRRWLIVRPDGRFMTQREIPALTSIIPEITRTDLVLHFGGRSVAVDLEQPGEPMEITIWKDRFRAFTQPDAIDQALTEHLGRPARFVRFDPDVIRPCNPDVSPPGAHAAFSDEFPLLLTNAASLARLNDGLLEVGAAPVPMERFRPNIVVEGLPAWAEDHHPLVRLEATELRLVSPCERCIVTTTDQQTGIRQGSEPIRTLRKLHADPAGKPLFGWNAVPVSPEKAAPVLRIGMPVRFLPGHEA
jgi:uncharacterized protein YcbX